MAFWPFGQGRDGECLGPALALLTSIRGRRYPFLRGELPKSCLTGRIVYSRVLIFPSYSRGFGGAELSQGTSLRFVTRPRLISTGE
jgi:hypothetical protein